jgi:xylulokinase
MLLGLDLGTGSLKALLMDPEGRVLGEASRSYPVLSPHPGWAETDPQEWWRAVAEAIGEAVGSRSAEVRAIGLSGQMHGVVLSKADGTPLRNAVLWADSRSGEKLGFYRLLGPEQLKRLANPITTGMAGPSLLWLRDLEMAYWQADWALQPKDWLRLRLTGTAASEPSDASATLLYDLVADTWFDELVEHLGLRRKILAPLQPSGSVAGELTVEAARHLGLRAGIPVAAGAGDTAAAMLGSGLVRPGAVQLSVGSGAQIVAPSAELQIDPTLRTHLYRAAAPGRWYNMAAMQNAGLGLEWVRGVLGLSWEEAYREAFSVGAGCEGLSFLPHLTGERTPHLDPKARGAWAGLGLGHTRAHLMRSALEGVAYAIRQGMEALESAGTVIPELRLAGGGTLDPRWRQLLADVLGKRLLAAETASASAKGAALLGGIAAGVYPDAEATTGLAGEAQLVAEPSSTLYEESYRRFCGLYLELKGWEAGR